MDIDTLLNDFEKNMVVNDEHIKLNNNQKRRQRLLFRQYDKIDINTKNALQLYLWHSRFREILGITMFDKIENNNL